MPFYEYECTACKFYVEVLQKISDEPLRKCPSCSKKALKKLVSAPVFRLKGGGWYETDFKSDKEEKRNLAGRDEAPETKSEESKTDAKPDSKDAPKPAEAKPAETRPASGAKPASVTTRTKPRAPAKAVSRPKAKAKPASKKKKRR